MEQETLEFLVVRGTLIGIPCFIWAGVRAGSYFVEKRIIPYLKSIKESAEESVSSQGGISVRQGWNARPAYGSVPLSCRIKNRIYNFAHPSRVITAELGPN